MKSGGKYLIRSNWENKKTNEEYYGDLSDFEQILAQPVYDGCVHGIAKCEGVLSRNRQEGRIERYGRKGVVNVLLYELERSVHAMIM